MESSATSQQPNLDSILRENRVFPPPAEFAAQAHVKSLEEYEALYRRSIQDPERFWAEIAAELHWFAPWTSVLEWQLPWAKWFVGGKINLCYNCVDRHALSGSKNKVAILWEGEPGETRKLTYGELYLEVQKFANVLKGLGIRKGDRVAVYMGMTPELAIALLACARIGAVHSVIFGGFAANALVDRINDASCVAVITQDGSYRRGQEVRLKAIVDEALEQLPHGEACGRLSPHRLRREHEARPRSVVAGSAGKSAGRVPGRAARRGRSALHPLHFGDNR